MNEDLVTAGALMGVWKLLLGPVGRASRITSRFRLRASWAKLSPKNEFLTSDDLLAVNAGWDLAMLAGFGPISLSFVSSCRISDLAFF